MLSSSQLFELFVVICIAYHFPYGFFKVRSAFLHAQAKSGPVRPDSMPTGLWVTLLIALQAIVYSIFPAVYIFTVVRAGLQQPPWMNALALPKMVSGVRLEGVWENALRMLGCFSNISLQSIVDSTFEHLGDQYHPIGRREKPRVVQTGPYAWVRHPLYAVSLLDATIWCLMLWSYAPLFAVLVSAALIAVKIPIEEAAILRDDGIREEYRAYMRKVPARLVPYVW